jgi:hypothetical protein
LANTKMKNSFGTALKLFSYSNMTASVLMTICTVKSPPAKPGAYYC